MPDLNAYQNRIISSGRKLIKRIYQSSDSGSLNTTIINQLLENFSAIRVDIYKYIDTEKTLVLEASGASDKVHPSMDNLLTKQSHPANIVLKEGKTLLIDQSDSAHLKQDAAIYLPIKDTEKTLGVLGLTFSQEPDYSLLPILKDIANALSNIWMLMPESNHLSSNQKSQAFMHQLKYYRLMVDYSPDLQMIIDIESYSIDEIGASCEQLLGYSTDELKDFPIMKILYPADIKKSMDMMKQAVLEGVNIRNFSNRVISKNREVIPLSWNAVLKGGKLFTSARKIEGINKEETINTDFDFVIRMESNGHIVDVFPGKTPNGKTLNYLLDTSLYENVSMQDLDNLLNLHSLLLDGQSCLKEEIHLNSPKGQSLIIRALFKGFNLENPGSGNAGIICLAKII